MSDNNNSCAGCKYLYSEGEGYSNYTWLSDVVYCALGKNENLPEELPLDWNHHPRYGDGGKDNWPCTNNSRCNEYDPGIFIRLDVDGEDGPADYTGDAEQIVEICRYSGRSAHGRRR